MSLSDMPTHELQRRLVDASDFMKEITSKDELTELDKFALDFAEQDYLTFHTELQRRGL